MRLFGEYVKQCCGGHGFLDVSGIHRTVKADEGIITAEGTNLVILQQTSRHILKAMQTVQQGGKCHGALEFFNDYEAILVSKCKKFNTLNEQLVNAFRARVIYFASRVSKKFADHLADGLDMNTVWNEKCQAELIAVAQHFSEAYLLSQAFEEMSKQPNMTEGIRPIIEKFLQIYAIYTMTQEMVSFVETGYLEEDDVENLKEMLRTLLEDVKPDAVTVVDGFGVRDEELLSVLGTKDGDVYNKLIKIVRENPLNKSHVIDGYFEHIRPIRAKL